MLSKELDSIMTKEYLVENYVDKNLSTYQIAAMIGCDFSTVIVRLRRFGITVKHKGWHLKGKKKSAETIAKVKKALTGKYVGKKSWKYKDGRTPLNVAIFNLPEYNIWRIGTFERDDYICTECGIRSGNGETVCLEAHHIKKFSIIMNEFLQGYSQFSPVEDKETLIRLAATYKPFWELSNGKTLCRKCHDKTYKTKEETQYGRNIEGNSQVVDH